MSVLSALGGLNSAFQLLGSAIIGLIARKIFLSSIIRKVYHVRKYDNIKYEVNRKDIDEEEDQND
jgi:hypothetical protein